MSPCQTRCQNVDTQYLAQWELLVKSTYVSLNLDCTFVVNNGLYYVRLIVELDALRVLPQLGYSAYIELRLSKAPHYFFKICYKKLNVFNSLHKPYAWECMTLIQITILEKPAGQGRLSKSRASYDSFWQLAHAL